MYARLVNPLLSFLNSIYCIQIKETIQVQKNLKITGEPSLAEL